MNKFKSLHEGTLSKIAVAAMTLTFANLIRKPFTEWDAFENGIIDEKGEILKKPKTIKEKESLNSLTNIVRKIKKIIIKYVGDSKILGFLIAAYLLKKESYSDLEIETEINSVLDESEQSLLNDCLMYVVESKQEI